MKLSQIGSHKKTYTANKIANYILSYARDKGDLITNKKLQKLLYYVQAWYLALYNDVLFDDDIEAWIHGPVVPAVYHKYKDFGWNFITPPETKLEDFDLPKKIKNHIAEVFFRYGDHTSEYLERLTHSEEPWLEARGNTPIERYSSKVISINTMKKFYKGLLKNVS